MADGGLLETIKKGLSSNKQAVDKAISDSEREKGKKKKPKSKFWDRFENIEGAEDLKPKAEKM